MTSAILFGITLGIRMIFETLGVFSVLFKILNKDALHFAIMLTIFLFLHKPFVGKFGLREITDEVELQKRRFTKIIKLLIIAAWILSAIYLSIAFLQISLRDPAFPEYPSRFGLGTFWSISLVFICLIFTSIINRFLADEKRMEKKVLRNASYGAAIIAFGLWFIQIVVFEVYLNKWLGFQLIIQDIRVLIIVVAGLYILVFFNLLRGKLLPEASVESTRKVKELLDVEIKKSKMSINSDLVMEDRESIFSDISEENEPRFPQGISLHFYTYLFKKITKSQSIEENSLLESNFNKESNKILAGLIWGLIIETMILSFFLYMSKSYTLAGVLFLSCISAFFMVVGDLTITYLFNRINPVNTRVPKIILQHSAIYGGLLTFGIWMVPFFAIFLYIFILITESVLINLIFIIIFSIALYTAGSRVIWWYATSIKMWDAGMKNASYVKKKASRVNLVWLIIDLPLRILSFFIFSGVGIKYTDLLSRFWVDHVWPTEYDLLIPILFNEFIIATINIIIGIFLVSRIYKRKISESVKFIILSYIVVYLCAIFITIFLGLFQSLILSYHYSLTDPRIPLIVASGIYTVSLLGSLRIKMTTESSEKIGDRFRASITTYEEDQYQDIAMGERQVILDVQNLITYFYTEEGVVRAVEGVSFKIYKGETLGLVGETGCGKSVTALSILRLVRPPGKIESGKVYFEGEDLHQKSMEEFLKYRGNRITMIFQDPLNSLNPVYKIGDQIAEVYRLHMQKELLIEAVKANTSIYDIARKWSRKILKDLNIPTPRVIFDRYPHELSGGMRQRVQIAMGLACGPRLLIADEPTTALDVTIQNQILQLMKDLKKKYNTSILFITHDLGIISKMCDRVAVMYSGFIVEYGDINKLFRTPYHPYTRGLIASVPIVGKKRELLDVIPGMVPNLIYPPSGCRFHPRCQYCFEPCDSKIPKSIEVEPDYFVACHLFDPEYKYLAELSIRKVEN